MSKRESNNQSRLQDLLADHALQGLTVADSAELVRLSSDEIGAEEIGREQRELEWTVASVAVELEPIDLVPMPKALREKIEADAVLWQAARRGIRLVPAEAPAPARPANTLGGAWLPWLIAAACLLLSVGVWVIRMPERFDSRAILAAADIQSTWQTNVLGVSGEVVWDTEKQTGFMRFRNLPVNDPSVEQYQLWIFDEKRDQARPVDGGVFDSTSKGELIIPIDAKLDVNRATMFAVTIEPPGGVVVSDRQRLILLAN